MNFIPQIETREITDEDLDNVSGGATYNGPYAITYDGLRDRYFRAGLVSAPLRSSGGTRPA